MADTVYAGKWQDGYSLHLRKSLVTIIQRSQVPLVLSAYGLINVNLNTFMKVHSQHFPLLIIEYTIALPYFLDAEAFMVLFHASSSNEETLASQTL